ncbi:hypothetical protein [Crocosphaera sp.]|uniref:hypothetical protein n=1 Tax=Crocosphaera sp. TaxID=2729996 RepID=UPI003F28ABDB|nr:hypothetical protein [Crocosphaera sp.]
MGLYTIFGAPNILRGKSQSGSMKAISAITNNVVSCLCSDYSPATLLTAAFRLPTLAHGLAFKPVAFPASKKQANTSSLS